MILAVTEPDILAAGRFPGPRQRGFDAVGDKGERAYRSTGPNSSGCDELADRQGSSQHIGIAGAREDVGGGVGQHAHRLIGIGRSHPPESSRRPKP